MPPKRKPKTKPKTRRPRRRRMTYDEAVKVLIKHKVIKKKSDLYAPQSRGSGGLLLGAI